MPNRSKTQNIFKVSPIKLDANGDLPNEIMLMQTGHWPNSIKGDFSISLDDLKQIKQNFDAGVGFPTDDASTGLAIDFKHEYDDQAAGWIKGLQLVEDGKGGGQLMASPIEWTDTGTEAVRNGRFKCISPSGYFGKKGTRMSAWPNPTDVKQTVKNVLDGAGLTNIPFLRGMSPVRASAAADNEGSDLDYDKVLFISENNDQINKGENMTVDELRVKERDALSVLELDFLVEHKAELSASELEKFKLEDETSTEKNELTAEDKDLLAAIKSGDKKVVAATETTVEKSTLDGLVATTNRYKEEKVKETLAAHVKRGAIKSDQAALDGFWGKQLLAAQSDDDRQAVTDAMDALASNELLATEIGNGGEVIAGSNAREQLDTLAHKKVEEAAKEGKDLLYGDALREVMASEANKDLVTADTQDIKNKAGV